MFGQEVYSNLRKQGHKVVGVFTVPDKDGKADPLGKFILNFSLICAPPGCVQISVCALCILFSGLLMVLRCTWTHSYH